MPAISSSLALPADVNPEDVVDDPCARIVENKIVADEDAPVTRGQRPQSPVELHRQGTNMRSQSRRQRAANTNLFFQAGRQAIPLRESRRQRPAVDHEIPVDRVTIFRHEDRHFLPHVLSHIFLRVVRLFDRFGFGLRIPSPPALRERAAAGQTRTSHAQYRNLTGDRMDGLTSFWLRADSGFETMQVPPEAPSTRSVRQACPW